MVDENAISLLKAALYEVTSLRALHHGNQEFKLWRDKVCDLLEMQFGKGSTESERFAKAAITLVYPSSDSEWQEKYLSDLGSYETALKSVLQKHALCVSLGKSAVGLARDPVNHAPPSAFIAHGGETPALTKVEAFLVALGVTPIVVEKQPSQDRSIDQNVEWYLNKCDCALILATKGDIDGRSGEFLPRGNVCIEIGRCQERFPGRTIYLLEDDTRFPSNISEKVWERFTQDNMERAFLKIAKEIKAFGLIKTVKPTLGG